MGEPPWRLKPPREATLATCPLLAQTAPTPYGAFGTRWWSFRQPEPHSTLSCITVQQPWPQPQPPWAVSTQTPSLKQHSVRSLPRPLPPLHAPVLGLQETSALCTSISSNPTSFFSSPAPKGFSFRPLDLCQGCLPLLCFPRPPFSHGGQELLLRVHSPGLSSGNHSSSCPAVSVASAGWLWPRASQEAALKVSAQATVI